MEILRVENLSFTYPNNDKKALNNINFTINKGDFVVVCGQSGSGKTTLLKMMKKEIAPVGSKEGQVYYCDKAIDELSSKTSVEKIGFVFQKPEQQIVTDKVWHELAFGLESLGYDSQYIRLRVGEMANYFGISSLFRSSTHSLSGGQKQLMNLASVMAMSPEILILDEPTSQLDPIAADEFIGTLKKLNTELGLTIILIEHRLQEVFPIADKVAVLDNGELIAYDTPKNVCKNLSQHKISYGFPSAVRIWQGANIKGECPLTVKEGREFINSNFSERKIALKEEAVDKNIKIQLKDVFFRYEKSSPDVLCGTNLTIYEGEHFCILGGNGTGKTTTLKVLSGVKRPYRGKILLDNKNVTKSSNVKCSRQGVAMLPQNPETVFIKTSVVEDYMELLKSKNIKENEASEKIACIAKELEIEHLLNKHPYDLSGGEMQKCAIGKLLLSNPNVILLDEPTKGIDAFGKENLGKILNNLKSSGITIITVTHDVEFAACVADRCGLFFDGEVLSSSVPQRFFSMNNFYTTAASRISRDKFANAVTVEDVLALIKEEQNE
jgi:energy-coupling factor transport system ATP-binding protein